MIWGNQQSLFGQMYRPNSGGLYSMPMANKPQSPWAPNSVQGNAWDKSLARQSRLQARSANRQNWLWNTFGYSDNQRKFRENTQMQQRTNLFPMFGFAFGSTQQPWQQPYQNAMGGMW